MKTLRPRSMAHLARRTDAGHKKAMSDHRIAASSGVVNLYPFEPPGRAARTCDLRGEHRHRRPGTDPRSARTTTCHRCRRPRPIMRRVIAELAANKGATTLALRRKLAAKAFARTASYVRHRQLVRQAQARPSPSG